MVPASEELSPSGMVCAVGVMGVLMGAQVIMQPLGETAHS